MKLFIKNINDGQNELWVRSLLNELQVSFESDIELGELVIGKTIPPVKFEELKQRLEAKGLPVIYDRKHILSEQVKYIVHEMLMSEEPPLENYSRHISNRLHLNYTYLANIFSETQGITIEHFTINKKIAKVKDYLIYNDYSISQIADMLHYSSIGHLSNQFKKVTGMNPTEFKKHAQKEASL